MKLDKKYVCVFVSLLFLIALYSIYHDDVKEQTPVCVMFTFVNAAKNSRFQNAFRTTASSLFRHASVPLDIFIIVDKASKELGEDIIKQSSSHMTHRHKINTLDLDKLAEGMGTITRMMQKHFSKKNNYFDHVLFFLSIGLYRVLPGNFHRVIMLDIDLKFTDDISKLYDRFKLFTNENIIGIGRELQPIYRTLFQQYRNYHKGTRVGDPPPYGLAGFNSGVLLLDLDRMRNSMLYNSQLTEECLARLTDEFKFKGYLGDQDFYTLLGMKYPQLFHPLPCEWNRQLCQSKRRQGEEHIFDQYHRCDQEVKIYHGNCHAKFP